MSSCTFLGFHESGCFDFFKCHIGEVIDSLSPSVNVAVFVMFPDGSNFVEKEVKPVDRGFVEWRFELGVNFGDLFKTQIAIACQLISKCGIELSIADRSIDEEEQSDNNESFCSHCQIYVIIYF